MTWTKLLSKELSVLVIWPSRHQIRAKLPECFKKLFPKTRVISDCTEVCLWSDYKHYCTITFLVCITPDEAVSWVSPVYGGRGSNIPIGRDSGFFDF